jgi:hypothetical protein
MARSPGAGGMARSPGAGGMVRSPGAERTTAVQYSPTEKRHFDDSSDLDHIESLREFLLFALRCHQS